jgi:hypothetical protein
MRRHRAIGGKKSAGTEKGPYVTYNPLGLRQNHFFFAAGGQGLEGVVFVSLRNVVSGEVKELARWDGEVAYASPT